MILFHDVYVFYRQHERIIMKKAQQIDFYAPYQMPAGHLIYGAAAANRRVADAGGYNKLSYDFVHRYAYGIQQGSEG